MDNTSKIFVKLEDYEDIKEILSLMSDKVKEAREVLAKIYDIKSKEDTAVERWNSNLNKVEEKIDKINRALD